MKMFFNNGHTSVSATAMAGTRTAVLTLVCLMILQCAFATTWYVDATIGNDANAGLSESSPFQTIQAAVDNAETKDTILVASGTYSYIDIPISKADLTISATESATNTVIEGAYNHRCVTVGDGSVTNVYINGFTLTGGYVAGQRPGAGAFGGTYNNCIISGNKCGGLSSGAGAVNCTLTGCMISNNIASSTTAGTAGIINCIASNCIISSNRSDGSGPGGAEGSTLIECTITGNKTDQGRSGGAQNCKLYRCLIEDNTCSASDCGRDINDGIAYDCIIKANKSRSIAGTKCYNCTIVSSIGSPGIGRGTALYNCVVSSVGNAFSINGDYNFKVNLANCLLNNVSLGNYVSKVDCATNNPLFVGDSDYHLQADSPCVDKGNNSYVMTSIDFAGRTRIINSKVDIGAYEYLAPCVVSSISAAQRYPWNGKVDVQIKLETPDNNNCVVTLSVKDVEGGTNLPMRAVYKQDGIAVNMAGESLPPGTYSWIWDAAADLPDGFQCDRVTVEVTAE